MPGINRDFACPDTLALSYISVETTTPGSVVALAESRKTAKYYSSLDFTLYNFVPIAIDTMGAFGAKSLNFIRKLGKKNYIALWRSISLFTSYSAPLGGYTTG